MVASFMMEKMEMMKMPTMIIGNTPAMIRCLHFCCLVFIGGQSFA